MPKKKPIITAADDYVPMSDSVGHGLEIPVKQAPKDEELITIETKPTKNTKKNSQNNPKAAKKVKIGKLQNRKMSTELEVEETLLPRKRKSGSYTLIITEKPQAALKIASALGNFKKLSDSGVPYYELEKEGKKIKIACAVGHLFTLSSQEKGFPIFKIEWQPNFKVRKKDFSRKYYNTLVKLSRDASDFIVATDYDIEGEVIGLNIIRYIAREKDAKRMKFSTLTANELNTAYKNAARELNWSQGIAGETRHKLDWFYGINLSRALMSAIKSTGRFKIMSIGRVQGPALKLIVEKERSILAFKPSPYWEIFIDTDRDVSLKYTDRIVKKEELEKFRSLQGKRGQATTIKTEQILPPLPPFDLTTLQTEAYKFHGINPARCLQIAQNLYLAGLISYPRTSSQKLPVEIGYTSILEKIKKQFGFKGLTRSKPIEGNKTDPAHPSIYPTGEFSGLEGEDKKIYELIVKRFASCFAEDAKLANKKIKALVEGLAFEASGMGITKKGWLEIYPTKFKENEIPDLNGSFIVKKVNIEEKETQPPRRFTPASIVSELEKRDLGTKATRASIIETLYDRGYVKGQSIEATPLGISLIETLEKNSPIIIDEELTRHFEKEMDSLQEKEKSQLQGEEDKIIGEAKKAIIKISADFKQKESKIGKELVNAQEQHWKQEKEANTLNVCPKCGKGNLRILFNRGLRRYFVACSAYPECKTTFSLPPNSLIKPAGKVCELCNWPKLLAIRKARRPWEFCFNPACVSRQQNSSDSSAEKAETESKVETKEESYHL